MCLLNQRWNLAKRTRSKCPHLHYLLSLSTTFPLSLPPARSSGSGSGQRRRGGGGGVEDGEPGGEGEGTRGEERGGEGRGREGRAGVRRSSNCQKSVSHRLHRLVMLAVSGGALVVNSCVMHGLIILLNVPILCFVLFSRQAIARALSVHVLYRSRAQRDIIQEILP